MNKQELFGVLERMIETSKVAVLATVDKHGRPNMRWMTPTLVQGREGLLYAVTSPKFDKIAHIAVHAHVQWIIQSKALDEILTVNGTMTAIDNPSLKSEVVQSIGPTLAVFWRVNEEASDLVVLETEIEEAVYFKPMKKIKERLILREVG